MKTVAITSFPLSEEFFDKPAECPTLKVQIDLNNTAILYYLWRTISLQAHRSRGNLFILICLFENQLTVMRTRALRKLLRTTNENLSVLKAHGL